ncbi:VWA domain-containing protein [Nocardia sp. NBC_00565]|uniref:vWA domain-containing protein n=1 Tax=Nocardia sp. NBC_00565 TaxID=2975993 RepID=UPI002E811A02|nr:VWA domain-containing protein [Nocardia sp. NBC_00565]WUC05251.1 VWA domain-containing protein [Nocardia sp. NBC_00565]
MSRFTQRITRFTAAAAAGLIGLSVAALPAQAQQSPEAPQYAPTMLILDASGSMQRPDPAGTMMDAAKSAVRSFVGTAPAESKVGLTVYGTSTGNTEAEKTSGCRDVQVLHKPETLDRTALTSAVDGIKASGWTPMGTALRQAAGTLPKSGPRSIVLVSDGDDTCSPPDPCEVARELKQQGLDLVVHAIGFAVDAKARAQLTCMAQATGGTYSDAADGPALERTLPRVSSAALRNYKAVGTPITGTGKYDTAPVATPGQYLDTLGQKEKRYWAVDVPAGATAYFSGTLSFPRLPDIPATEDMNTLQLRIYDADGQDCNAFEFEQATSSSDGVALTVAEAFDGATKQPTSGSSDKCKGGGRYYFQLTWDRVSAGVPERLPIELLVGIEPAVTDAGPVAVAPFTAFTEPSGAGTPVSGGPSFTAASTLPGSGRYTDTMQQGEFVFYRVKLDWGQGLAYRVHYGGNGRHGVDNISSVRTTLYNPIREAIDSDFASYTGSDTVLPTNKAMGTVPIRYNNRKSDALDPRKEAVAGWYYIAVKLGSNFTDKGINTPVSVQLNLTVTGATESGPTYATTVGDGVFGENSTGAKVPTSRTPGTATAAAESAASESKSSTALIVIAVIGVAVIGVLGVLGGWLAARRRRS